MMRPAPAIGNHPNDHNVVLLDRAAGPAPGFDLLAGLGDPVASRAPSRTGARPFLIGVFAASLLVALSGALLIALAVVGLIAVLIAGFELVSRQLRRPAKPRVGAFDQQVSF